MKEGTTKRLAVIAAAKWIAFVVLAVVAALAAHEWLGLGVNQ